MNAIQIGKIFKGEKTDQTAVVINVTEKSYVFQLASGQKIALRRWHIGWCKDACFFRLNGEHYSCEYEQVNN